MLHQFVQDMQGMLQRALLVRSLLVQSRKERGVDLEIKINE